MTRRARYVSRAATLGGALSLLLISSVDDVRTQSAPGRVIWRGINTVSSTGPTCNSQLVQTFEFVGEEVPNTDPKWLSRKVTWDWSESCAAEVLVLEATGGATPQRVLRPWSASCVNKGEADLNLDPNPERRGQCQESPALGNISNYSYPTLGWTGPRPPEEMRNGCAYASRSRILGSDGSVHVTTYSVTVSRGQPDAVVAVDRREYEAFVPEPGKTLTFIAKSSRPARFRFELDRAGTSRFPGYATNANVDDVFFMQHNLGHLREQYTNGGADVIFDPERFGAVGWSRRDLHFVETRTAETGVLVPVTAMDFGAVGRLRAYVESPDCGGSWQPVNILVNGRSGDAIDLPLDQDDNLIADALEQYRGIDPGSDDDAEPKGNGMAGDGLTAFEEYRGFLTRGADCSEYSSVGSWSDEHIRSAPHHKNLFIHTPDPELVVMLENFAWSSGISVHPICERHYDNNDTRVVNFTLRDAALRSWRGHTVSQEEPQHGLWVLPVDEIEEGLVGLARPVRADLLGPPKMTRVVEILKPGPVAPVEGLDNALVARYAAGPAGPSMNAIDWAVRHELGHAVGIPHHSDGIESWRVVAGKLNVTTKLSPLQGDGGPPDFSILESGQTLEELAPHALLVEPGPECSSSSHSAVYRKGTFAGCVTQTIARRGQQNSGDHICPMRYRGALGDYYEPSGTQARFVWSGEVAETSYSSYTGNRTEMRRLYVDAWAGRLLRYRSEYEREWLGRFCTSVKGTGINDLPGDLNHNGDAGRDKHCGEFLVVNDVAARGVR